ncbi:hypothetical protein Bbelb_132420 [Branchiostoma belcheri]|nr:hypothetical protein Bbelb_132420 [Branchiostoma belcheri]
MPPDPPTLLAPLALDSRFCARSLRLRARTSFPVNFRKLRAPSQNPKLKTCKLADVDSDSPLFVDALGDQGSLVLFQHLSQDMAIEGTVSSEVLKHIHIESPGHFVSFDTVRILDTEQDNFLRGVKEAHHPSLNRDGGRHRLPDTFNPVLTSHFKEAT